MVQSFFFFFPCSLLFSPRYFRLPSIILESTSEWQFFTAEPPLHKLSDPPSLRKIAERTCNFLFLCFRLTDMKHTDVPTVPLTLCKNGHRIPEPQLRQLSLLHLLRDRIQHKGSR